MNSPRSTNTRFPEPPKITDLPEEKRKLAKSRLQS